MAAEYKKDDRDKVELIDTLFLKLIDQHESWFVKHDEKATKKAKRRVSSVKGDNK